MKLPLNNFIQNISEASKNKPKPKSEEQKPEETNKNQAELFIDKIKTGTLPQELIPDKPIQKQLGPEENLDDLEFKRNFETGSSEPSIIQVPEISTIHPDQIIDIDLRKKIDYFLGSLSPKESEMFFKWAKNTAAVRERKPLDFVKDTSVNWK